MISQKTIQEIFETAKIEDVVGDFVNLRRRGVNLIGVCPFHNEKTPSFTVSPSKNIYKCFGCGAGGNSVNFLMEHENLTYPEALRQLAQKFNIEIEETVDTTEQLEERQRMDSLYLINDFAQKWFTKQLFETDEGKSVGLSYFKQRGFREETIKKFGLGYAPKTKDEFTVQAQHKGYKKELLIEAGLTSKRGFDFFRSRVQFAIRNGSGKVVGFGGRILDSKAKTAKYINTPDSEVYNKSKILYGIYFAKKTIRQEDNCLLVEGYTDVVSLSQSGIENVVASSGTSLTIDQIRLIKRHTENITMLFDGDPAGIKAALRGLDLILEQGLNVRIVLLPEKEDPDSYLTKVGTQAFKQFIADNASDFILFKTNLLLEETKGDPVKKSALIQDIVQSISKIFDPIKRSVFIKECAERLEINEQILVAATNKIMQTEIAKRRQKEIAKEVQEQAPIPESELGEIPKRNRGTQAISDDFQEKDIVRLLVAFADHELEPEVSVARYILSNMEEIMNEFDNDLYKKMIEIVAERLQKNLAMPNTFFTTHEDKEIRKTAIDLLSSKHEYSPNWEEKHESFMHTQPMPDQNWKKDTINGVDRFKFKKVIRLEKQNQEKLKALGKEDVISLMKILKVQKKLQEIRIELGTRIGTVGAIK